MKKLLIVADLGRVRAFRFEPDPLQEGRSGHAAEVEVPPLAETPKRIHDEVSDQAGEHERGDVPGKPGGMSYGEEHNFETEHERRLICGLARHISEIVLRENPKRWDLAAPQPICKRLQAELDPRARERLKDVAGLDLTKASLEEIEERFAGLHPS